MQHTKRYVTFHADINKTIRMLTFWFDVYLIVAYDFISIFLAGNCV